MANTSVRICVIGSRGRMGRAIAAVAEHTAGVTITAQVDTGDSIEAGLEISDVGIDFSSADAADEICSLALQQQRPLVIGTTGHSAAQRERIRTTAATLPIVLASNFSVGVNALFWLTGRTAGLLGEDFDVEIVETHHKMKKDAPSGTAKTLAEILKEKRGGTEIAVRSIREGEIVGEHTVIFAGPGERLELTHKAESRETFATGALTAAKWVFGKSAGLYSMQDVLGLG